MAGDERDEDLRALTDAWVQGRALIEAGDPAGALEVMVPAAAAIGDELPVLLLTDLSVAYERLAATGDPAAAAACLLTSARAARLAINRLPQGDPTEAASRAVVVHTSQAERFAGADGVSSARSLVERWDLVAPSSDRGDTSRAAWLHIGTAYLRLDDEGVGGSLPEAAAAFTRALPDHDVKAVPDELRLPATNALIAWVLAARTSADLDEAVTRALDVVLDADDRVSEADRQHVGTNLAAGITRLADRFSPSTMSDLRRRTIVRWAPDVLADARAAIEVGSTDRDLSSFLPDGPASQVLLAELEHWHGVMAEIAEALDADDGSDDDFELQLRLAVASDPVAATLVSLVLLLLVDDAGEDEPPVATGQEVVAVRAAGAEDDPPRTRTGAPDPFGVLYGAAISLMSSQVLAADDLVAELDDAAARFRDLGPHPEAWRIGGVLCLGYLGWLERATDDDGSSAAAAPRAIQAFAELLPLDVAPERCVGTLIALADLVDATAPRAAIEMLADLLVAAIDALPTSWEDLPDMTGLATVTIWALRTAGRGAAAAAIEATAAERLAPDGGAPPLGADGHGLRAMLAAGATLDGTGSIRDLAEQQLARFVHALEQDGPSRSRLAVAGSSTLTAISLDPDLVGTIDRDVLDRIHAAAKDYVDDPRRPRAGVIRTLRAMADEAVAPTWGCRSRSDGRSAGGPCTSAPSPSPGRTCPSAPSSPPPSPSSSRIEPTTTPSWRWPRPRPSAATWRPRCGPSWPSPA